MSNKLMYRLGLEELMEPEITEPTATLPEVQLETETLQSEITSDATAIDTLAGDTETMEELKGALEAALKSGTSRVDLQFARRAIQMVDKRWGFDYPIASTESSDDELVASMESGVGQRLKDMGRAIIEMLKKFLAKLKEWGGKLLSMLGLRKKKLTEIATEADKLQSQYEELVKAHGDEIAKPTKEWLEPRLGYLVNLIQPGKAAVPSTAQEFDNQITVIEKSLRQMQSMNFIMEHGLLKYFSDAKHRMDISYEEIHTRIMGILKQDGFTPMGKRNEGVLNKDEYPDYLTLSGVWLPGFKVLGVRYHKDQGGLPHVYVDSSNSRLTAADEDSRSFMMKKLVETTLPAPKELSEAAKSMAKLLDALSKSVDAALSSQSKLVNDIDRIVSDANKDNNGDLLKFMNNMATAYTTSVGRTISGISEYVRTYVDSFTKYSHDVSTRYQRWHDAKHNAD